jgi:hypothetical protein
MRSGLVFSLFSPWPAGDRMYGTMMKKLKRVPVHPPSLRRHHRSSSFDEFRCFVGINFCRIIPYQQQTTGGLCLVRPAFATRVREAHGTCSLRTSTDSRLGFQACSPERRGVNMFFLCRPNTTSYRYQQGRLLPYF